ncbi:hypothetical protein BN1058_02233 [Paraliobacillus sp. PM-2]|uniref:DUF2922 domain-containing protein n=1 Tax=Paraliobacillus sp. PM-2 TaxID=1462524 RepID=UPI00061C2F5D|nr:DUF2922 domain-containing protein [Paraliobacillus sp. PM-2]CQR47900.1 hypothetical protein BN1058_02233 [Paraliobacillus sp. PM-2]
MKRLELKFLDEQDKTVTISLDSPAEPVDAMAITAAMDQILAQQVLYSSGGDMVSKKSARIVERNVTDIQI